MTDLDDLRAKLERATLKLPWEEFEYPSGNVGELVFGADDCKVFETKDDNVRALIVAAVNALPWLLDRLDELERAK